MIKVGIVIDSWKYPIFKKHLDDGGFKYKKFKGPNKVGSKSNKRKGLEGQLFTLKVDTANLMLLQDVIRSVNEEAARYRDIIAK